MQHKIQNKSDALKISISYRRTIKEYISKRWEKKREGGLLKIQLSEGLQITQGEKGTHSTLLGSLITAHVGCTQPAESGLFWENFKNFKTEFLDFFLLKNRGQSVYLA